MFRLCQNEVVKMGLYRSGEGVYGSAIMGGFGRESCSNLNGEVGGDPVGSTDPEVILWGPQILRCSRIYNLAPN